MNTSGINAALAVVHTELITTGEIRNTETRATVMAITSLIEKAVPIDAREWHRAGQLPTPNTSLILRMKDGTETPGVRPSYVESRSQVDLGYQTHCGKKLIDVIEWSIE